jgi:hypothetical protein
MRALARVMTTDQVGRREEVKRVLEMRLTTCEGRIKELEDLQKIEFDRCWAIKAFVIEEMDMNEINRVIAL